MLYRCLVWQNPVEGHLLVTELRKQMPELLPSLELQKMNLVGFRTMLEVHLQPVTFEGGMAFFPFHLASEERQLK